MSEGVVDYRVDLGNPCEHLVHVTMRFRAGSPRPAVSMPAWTPGSYLLREFGRHVQRLEVRVDGEAGGVAKIGRSTWQIEAPAGAEVEVDYQVYAHELSVRTSHVDASHAFLLGTSLFLYVEGGLDRPAIVRFETPAGWALHTTLQPFPSGGHDAFRAVDYDDLVDHPVEGGADHRVLDFEVGGVPHRVVIWGRGNYEPERLGRDMAKVVAANADLFGGLPYQRYLFIIQSGGRRGGLEHRNSCAVAWPRHRFAEDEDYADFLGLVAHEHFHVWNVKRIRPSALGPFDYLRENHSRALWAMEGVTSYYDQRQLLRAGLIEPEGYLERVARRIDRLQAVPGRLVDSLESASFDAWIKQYRAGEQTPNATVSYYLKGALVALLLDLELRRLTAGAQSYDEVMRTLWARQRGGEAGLSDDAFKAVLVELGGEPMRAWLARYVERPGAIDWDHHLDAVGLHLTVKEAGQQPSLGIRRRQRGERVYVATVLSDGPNAGRDLCPGDEIVGIDGLRVTRRNWERVLAQLPVEGEVEMTLSRRGVLRSVTVGLEPDRGKAVIEPVSEPSPEQLARYREWLFVEGPREAEE
jgi:predicted metalloprotease with PDZ domain